MVKKVVDPTKARDIIVKMVAHMIVDEQGIPLSQATPIAKTLWNKAVQRRQEKRKASQIGG